MQSPPVPRYLVPPRSKYSPQHLVLKHPQPPFLPQCQRPSFTPIQNNRQDYSTIYFDLYTTLVLAMFYRWENCFPTIGGNVFQWASISREFWGTLRMWRRWGYRVLHSSLQGVYVCGGHLVLVPAWNWRARLHLVIRLKINCAIITRIHMPSWLHRDS